MKKTILLFAAVIVMFSSCKPTVQQPVKIADYLWEVTVDDYPSEAPNYMIDQVGTEFGCSAVRNGNYYGRNLDFFVSEVAEVIVHTTAKADRHASVGVGRLLTMTDEDIAKGVTAEELALLPWGMFDGINDAGLYCNMNVTPSSDSGIPHTSPNPGLPEVYCAFLVRALLDNCATVEEAIQFVNSHDVTGMDKGGFDLHFMIGDPEKTVVLEFIDNKAVFGEHNIMTNFLVNKLPEYTPHADGVERYDILVENYDEGGKSMEGMYNLLKRVRFSQCYDPETTPFWKSEFAGEESGRTIDCTVEEVLADPSVQQAIEYFKSFKETGNYTKEMGLWFTTHTSIYDIANKKLCVTIRENYDQKFEFAL
ncbi:MAG: carcinine hydrolase/isopenicillin-N N-acyltransferase family protein [Bacteroidales bacterium]|nr:carcinine hydrolase/isopenicillin-N N-acyltransferase family protein [Bacteroidales bacterium]